MLRQEMKRRFDDIIANKVLKSNSFCMSAVKYRDLLDEIKLAKSGKKVNRHYWLLQHYEMLLINGEEKLITPMVNDSPVLFYITQEELFDVLYDIHDSLGHVGRDRMRKETQRRYKNITTEDVSTFLSLCETCVQKKSTDKKLFLLKPRPPSLITSRCQVDLMDYSNRADGLYKYIMIYQDMQTKFTILRPVKSDKVEEVAHELLDIFLLFGAPNIIQSDIGRDFCKRLIENLKLSWPPLKIIHGKAKIVTGKDRKIHQSADATLLLKQELKNLLNNWMQDNLTNKWSAGLPFIQFAKNRTELPGANKRSPYQAMFGHAAKMGLNTTNLSRDVVQELQTEEDLDKVISVGETNQPEEIMTEDNTTTPTMPSKAIAIEVQTDVQCGVCRTHVIKTPGSDMCLRCMQQYQMNDGRAQEQTSLWMGHEFIVKTNYSNK